MSEKNLDFFENFSSKQVAGTAAHHIDQPISRARANHSQIKILWSLAWKLLIVMTLFLIVFFSRITISGNDPNNPNSGRFPKIGISSLFAAFRNYLTNDVGNLRGGDSDRVNILLLGIGGYGHEGPELTDTMILVSLQPSTNKLALISIPRDLYVPVDAQNWDKINAINAIGENREPGSGGELTSQVVSGIFGIPIQYYARIDFSGFEKLIDDLSGIEVTVDRTFIDHEYPDNNFEFQVVNFKQGKQKMDGATALKFARSRHGNNGEGSDFARSLRQQKILIAIKNKATSFGTLANPTRISKMLGNLQRSIATNMRLEEISQLARAIQDSELDQAISFNFNDAPDNFLVAGYASTGAYILSPKSGDFSDISKFIRDIFNQTDLDNLATVTSAHATARYVDPSPVTSTTNTADISGTSSTSDITNPLPPAEILLLNGTIKNGLAGKISQILAKQSFEVSRTGNAPTQDYEKTVIYTLNKDYATETATLKNFFSANVSSKLPSSVAAEIQTGENFDFVIILGVNSLDK